MVVFSKSNAIKSLLVVFRTWLNVTTFTDKATGSVISTGDTSNSTRHSYGVGHSSPNRNLRGVIRQTLSRVDTVCADPVPHDGDREVDDFLSKPTDAWKKNAGFPWLIFNTHGLAPPCEGTFRERFFRRWHRKCERSVAACPCHRLPPNRPVRHPARQGDCPNPTPHNHPGQSRRDLAAEWNRRIIMHSLHKIHCYIVM